MTAGQNAAQLKGSSLPTGFVTMVLIVAIVALVAAVAGFVISSHPAAAPAASTAQNAARLQFLAEEHGYTAAAASATSAARLQWLIDEHSSTVADPSAAALYQQFRTEERDSSPMPQRSGVNSRGK